MNATTTKETRAERIARLSREAIEATKAKVKPRAKATVIEDAEIKSEPVIEDAFLKRLMEQFGEFKMPSGRRMIVSVIAQTIVGLGIGYIGGQLIGYALVGAALLSGSVLLQWMIWILGMALIAYSTYKVALRVGRYIALGEIDHDFGRARNWVRGVFNRSEVAHA